MKYFSPSYWLKLWVLSAPLFNDQTQGVYAKSINNKNIKDWASENTTSLDLISNNNNSEFITHQTHLDTQNLVVNLSQDTSTDSSWNLEARPKNDQQAALWEHAIEEQHHHDLQAERNRHKRENKKDILEIWEKLIIDEHNPQEYMNSLQRIINVLRNLNIFIDIPDTNAYTLNPLPDASYGYFRLPVEIRGSDPQTQQSIIRNFELVISTDALYIQGFIVTHHDTGSHTSDIQTYYYFDPTKGTDSGSRNPQLTEIPEISSNMLSFGNSYRWLLNRNDVSIRWQNVFESMVTVTNMAEDNNRPGRDSLSAALGVVVVFTVEVLRFRALEEMINEQIITNNHYILLALNDENDIYQLLIRWGHGSQITNTHIINMLFNNNDRLINKEISNRINSLKWKDEKKFYRDLIQNINNQNITPLNELATFMNSPSYRVLLLAIAVFENFINRNCNRKKRGVINKFWNEKFCDLKPQIDKIQGEITAVKILDTNNESDNLKAGTIYVGTTNGVYFINTVGQVNKFDGLNFPITSIELDGNGSAYVTNEQSEIYHLDLHGLGSKKLENMESSDLEKEIKLYYNDKKENEVIGFVPTNSVIRKSRIYNLNLGNINPVDNYKKLEFIGDTLNNRLRWGSNENNCWEFTSDYKLNHCRYQNITGKNLNTYLQYRKNEFRDIIKDEIISADTSASEICRQYTPQVLDNIDEYYYSARVFGSHSFGLRSHYEWSKNQGHINYYIQTAFCVYADWIASEASLESWFFIGNGIRLYNDDTNTRKKRDVFDISKLDEKTYNNKTIVVNELQNTTQWDKNISNLINHEQDLPAINNQSSYTNNNVTAGV